MAGIATITRISHTHESRLFALPTKMKNLIITLALLFGTSVAVSAADWPGVYKVMSTKGIPYYITLTADGGVSSTLEEGFHGSWEEKDGKAYITFASRWKAILSNENGKVTKTAFRPGKAFTDKPDSVTQADRVNASPNPSNTK